MIFKKYFSFQFWIDISTTIIFAFAKFSEESGLMNLFMLRLYTLYDKITNIDKRY